MVRPSVVWASKYNKGCMRIEFRVWGLGYINRERRTVEGSSGSRI